MITSNDIIRTKESSDKEVTHRLAYRQQKNRRCMNVAILEQPGIFGGDIGHDPLELALYEATKIEDARLKNSNSESWEKQSMLNNPEILRYKSSHLYKTLDMTHIVHDDTTSCFIDKEPYSVESNHSILLDEFKTQNKDRNVTSQNSRHKHKFSLCSRMPYLSNCGSFDDEGISTTTSLGSSVSPKRESPVSQLKDKEHSSPIDGSDATCVFNVDGLPWPYRILVRDYRLFLFCLTIGNTH